MVAFHFPPFAGSSGVQRTLRFVQHLPGLGWEPLVLSANPMAYEKTSDDLMAEVPADRIVNRAWALDSSRHLSFAGRYFAVTARPDRWISWKFDAVRQGMKLIRAYQPDVIWSTYPIATAHLIGAELSRLSGLPWVADFRDPMAQEGYPADPKTWQQFSEIEAQAIRQARFSTFTTPGAVRTYRARYPEAEQRIGLLENGYDEFSFVAAEALSKTRQPLNPGKITLLHSGVVYPAERDPMALFQALVRLKEGVPPFVIRFRASSQDALLGELAKRHGIEEFVQVMPPLGYTEALQEMLSAEALLVLQAGNCNEQIPAKLYEYLRAGRPIVGLTDPVGDTAWLLAQAGIDWLAPLDDPLAIEHRLRQVLTDLATGIHPCIDPLPIRQASRQHRTCELAMIFDAVASVGLS